MKKWMMTAAAAGMSMLFAASAYAAGWELGTGEHASDWKYVNADGSQMTGWHTIDGNNDGIAEWYCFNQDGWLKVSTTTEDGYTVNENGAWVKDGKVVTVQTGSADGSSAGAAAQSGQGMPLGRYDLKYNVVNGQERELSMNVLYTSYVELVASSEESATVLVVAVDTYGNYRQYYRTFTKQSDGVFASEEGDFMEMNAKHGIIYIGEKNYGKGAEYVYKAN